MNLAESAAFLLQPENAHYTLVSTSDNDRETDNSYVYYVYLLRVGSDDDFPIELLECQGLIPSDHLDQECLRFATTNDLCEYAKSHDSFLLSRAFSVHQGLVLNPSIKATRAALLNYRDNAAF